MHELSIVLSIVDTAEAQARKYEATGVERIDLEIGTMAGIEPDALAFAWEAALPGTILAGAERHIHYIQARARCLDCGHEFNVQQLYEACPQCGEYFTELLQGQELKIKSITLTTAEEVIS